MPASPLRGKTVLVTGATGGIGLAAAVVLAGMGAEVVITGRSAARMDTACVAPRYRRHRHLEPRRARFTLEGWAVSRPVHPCQGAHVESSARLTHLNAA